MINVLCRTWEKNWPEVRAVLRGDVPRFVSAARPEEYGSCVPVFCYHAIDPDTFGEDLAFLKRNGYTTLDADELVDHMAGQHVAPARSVVLSIDDGLLDLYTDAFPLLKEFDMTAVAFIAPGLHTQQKASRNEPIRLCTWSEIEEMHISGLVDFQCHTLEHRLMDRWPTPSPIYSKHGRVALQRTAPQPIEMDLTKARAAIEDRLNKKVQHLALPQYVSDVTGMRAALDCGFRAVWWGLLRNRRGNDVGDSLTHLARISGEFLRRLPGEGRRPLMQVLSRRATKRVDELTPRSLMPSRARQRRVSGAVAQ